MAGFSSTVKPAKQFSSTVKPVIPKPANPFFAGATNGTWGPLSAPPPPAPPRLAPRPGPAAPGAAPGAAGQAAGTSGTQTSSSSSGAPPLDATALGNIAENTFKTGNQISGLTTGIGNLKTNLASDLAALAYQQPRDQLSLEQGANRNGALYSSVYNQNLGDLNHSYLTKQTNLTTAEGQAEGGLQSQINAILGGIPLFNQGQANESGQRAITAAGNIPPSTPPPPPAPPPASRTIEDGGFGGSTIQDGGFGAKPKATQSGGFRAAPNSKGAIALAKVLAKKR